jgi:hypothetical protein
MGVNKFAPNKTSDNLPEINDDEIPFVEYIRYLMGNGHYFLDNTIHRITDTFQEEIVYIYIDENLNFYDIIDFSGYDMSNNSDWVAFNDDCVYYNNGRYVGPVPMYNGWYGKIRR